MNTMKGWGGGERQTYLILKTLAKMGLSASLLCRIHSPIYKRAVSEGLRVIGVKNRLEAFFYLVNAKGKYEVIHTNTGRDQDTAVFAKLWTKVPLIHTRRTDTPLKKNPFTIWKYKKTDKVIAVCSSIKEEIKNVVGCDASVIYSAIEMEKPDEKSVEVPEGRIVGTVASLLPSKDPFTLVRAAKIVLEKRNDVTFLHFGDGPLRKKIEKMVHSLGISERYKMMGFREDLPSFFNRFEVFVITSIREGLCNSVLDAFIRKIPVVSTDAGGLSEIVNGRGILCPVKNPPRIAEGILRLLEDELLKNELTEKAYKYVIEHHNVQGMAKRYIEVYNFLSALHI